MDHGGAIEQLWSLFLACREAAVGPAVGARDSRSVADGAMVGASDAATEAVGEDDATTAAVGADDGATDCKKKTKTRGVRTGCGAPKKREETSSPTNDEGRRKACVIFNLCLYRYVLASAGVLLCAHWNDTSHETSFEPRLPRFNGGRRHRKTTRTQESSTRNMIYLSVSNSK